MDTKNTVIAMVLMVALVVTTQFILNAVNPPKPAGAAVTQPVAQPAAAQTAPVAVPAVAVNVPEEPARDIKVSTDLYTIVFNTKGAAISSLLLNKHLERETSLDKGHPLELVNRVNGGEGSLFALGFGGPEAKVADQVFSYESLGADTHIFTRTFTGTDGQGFILKKTFITVPGEYLIRVKVTIQSLGNQIPAIGTEKFAYSLSTGPQLGPVFKKIDQNQEMRKYYYFTGNKREELEFGKGPKSYTGSVQWAGLMGKYFGVILIPDTGAYTFTWNNVADAANQANHSTTMTLSRGNLKTSVTEDSFVFYLGPKEESLLLKYNKAADNSLKLQDLKMQEALDRNPVLGWLEWGMKWVMDVLINSWVQNWGITIIILSLVLRLVLWVPTHKSYESTSAMAAVGPKMTALQTKYKNDPQKLNLAMAELYKKEGINPLGGCLPMLIQIPIMFALWQMLSTHFDLRGAMFIPGWITDLSLPESVWSWGFPLPLLNWTDLRLMPILMVITQILSTMVTQPQTAQANQMKMLTYMLPLVFFFFFYDMPSGLVLYWTVTNVLSMGQQVIINAEIKKKRGAKA